MRLLFSLLIFAVLVLYCKESCQSPVYTNLEDDENLEQHLAAEEAEIEQLVLEEETNNEEQQTLAASEAERALDEQEKIIEQKRQNNLKKRKSRIQQHVEKENKINEEFQEALDEIQNNRRKLHNIKKPPKEGDVAQLLDPQPDTKPVEERDDTISIDQLEEQRAKIQMDKYEKAIAELEKDTVDIQTVLKDLEEAANSNNYQAHYKIGEIYENGMYDISLNFSKAMYHYNISASHGNPQAQRAVAFMLDTGKLGKIDVPLALLYYTFAARNFDVEAAHILGYKYLKGINVPKSCSNAILHYKTVADYASKHHVTATSQFNAERLSELFETGDMTSTEEDLIQYYQFNAANGEANAQATMGQVHLAGNHGMPQNNNLARDYFARAAAQDHPLALAYLGHMYENGLGVEVDNTTSKEYYERAAEKGNAMAKNKLGIMYLLGKGVPKSYSKALEYFKESANQMNPDAQLNLGLMYTDGLGVNKDPATAFSYFTLAAGQGQITAQHQAAKCYHYGIGTVQSCESAIKLYKRVAEKGIWKKQFNEALKFYLDGDYDRALIRYEKLAIRGYELAQSNAAWMYDQGLFDSKQLASDDVARFVKAMYYYHRSAEQQNSVSNLKLGDYYFYGKGTKPDFKKSATYYRFASEMRNPQATFNIGYMHQFGLGLPKDFHLAKRYYDDALRYDMLKAYWPVTIALACWAVHFVVDGEFFAVYGDEIQEQINVYLQSYDISLENLLLIVAGVLLILALIIRRILS